MVEIPESPPTRLRAGDTWQWTRSFAEYPADLWTLTTYFRIGSNIQKDAVATADGVAFAVTVDADDSRDYPPGRYRYVERVSSGTVAYTVGEGEVEVLPDRSHVAVDDRSWEQRCLEAIQAVMENRASTDQLSLTVDNTALSRMSWQELEDAYMRFKRRCDRQRGLDVERIVVRL